MTMRFPTDDADAVALDSEARLQVRRKRIKVGCHRCGEVYIAGGSHLGSDYCDVRTRERQHAHNGREPVNGNLLKLCDDAGIRYVLDERGGFGYVEGAYRNTVAAPRHYAPRWAVRVLMRTARMHRPRRVLLLQAMQDARLREVRAYLLVNGSTGWLLETYRQLRLPSRDEVVAAIAGEWASHTEDERWNWLDSEARVLALAALKRSERGAL